MTSVEFIRAYSSQPTRFVYGRRQRRIRIFANPTLSNPKHKLKSYYIVRDDKLINESFSSYRWKLNMTYRSESIVRLIDFYC